MSKLDLIITMIGGLFAVSGWAFHLLWGRIEKVSDSVLELAKIVGNHHEHRLTALEAFVGIKEPDSGEEG